MKTVAVIGCGRIANSAHFPALSSLDDVRIKYACDLILDKANLVKENFPKVENVTTDYHEVLADPEVEAVWVLTPNYAHYTVAMDALKAGKHVFCEKPITVNYALSCEMAEQADKVGKMLNIGVCNRHNKSVELIEEMVREGKLGNVYHIYCSFRHCRSIPGLGGPFTIKSQSGGGVLIDWGIHFLDLILYILGGAKLKTVTCNTYNEIAKDMKSYKYRSMWAENTSDVLNGTNDVDDFVTGYIRTDKASISFNGAWAQNLDHDEMYVDFLGDKGGVRLDYCGQFSFFDSKDLSTVKTDHEIPNPYTKEDRAFLDSIDSGIRDKNNVESVLESAKLLDYLYRSAEQNKEISF